MKQRFLLLVFIPLLTAVGPIQARPLFTEEVATLTATTFEAAFSPSFRIDEFETPASKYTTANLPFRARYGIHRRIDFGFTLNQVSHSLETGELKLKGSRPALFSPELKFSPYDHLGFLAIWHVALKEKPEQELPIARGDDLELMALIKLPFRWSTHLNIGYLFRDSYETRFGVENAQLSTIQPSDIFEARASLEIPLRYALSILTEAAYYSVGKKQVNDADLDGSEGEAADALIGLVWERLGWNIGLGAAFGLLEESHTSFDLSRGAGDVMYKFSLAYKLKARKPQS